MKRKFLPLAACLFLVFSGSACKKCYECTTNSATVVTTGPYTTSTTSSGSDEFCGTKDEVASYEKENTGNTYTGVPGASTSIEVRTNCNPK
jgi:hypothetical protein